MNTQIKQRAKDIVSADIVNILIGTGIFYLASMISASLTGNIIGNAAAGLINAVSGACGACFYFRAYHRGKADINDIFALLKDSMHLSKILTIMVAMWLINTLIGIAGSFMLIIPFIGVPVWTVITLLVSLLLRIVWHLFVANPDYPTEYYLKGSGEYMGSELISFLWFSFSISIVPALIQAVLAIFVNSTIAGLLCLPFEAYINLAVAGFVAGIIPDEWYSGTAAF